MKAKTATTALNTDHVTGMLQHEKGGVIYYFVPLGAIPGNTAATRNGQRYVFHECSTTQRCRRRLRATHERKQHSSTVRTTSEAFRLASLDTAEGAAMANVDLAEEARGAATHQLRAQVYVPTGPAAPAL